MRLALKSGYMQPLRCELDICEPKNGVVVLGFSLVAFATAGEDPDRYQESLGVELHWVIP